VVVVRRQARSAGATGTIDVSSAPSTIGDARGVIRDGSNRPVRVPLPPKPLTDQSSSAVTWCAQREMV
jgi:hypothetical protein